MLQSWSFAISGPIGIYRYNRSPTIAPVKLHTRQALANQNKLSPKSRRLYHIRVSIFMDKEPRETYELFMWTD